MDINKFRVTMDSFYKNVIVNAKYKMTGNVARIPINTDGTWSAVVGKGPGRQRYYNTRNSHCQMIDI